MNLVDLGIGHPDDAILPLDAVQQAANHLLGRRDKSCLQYGPEQGSESLRTKLAQFLGRHYRATVSSADLLITAGASHGLDLVLQRFTRPGDTIFVEDPTYSFVFDVFADRRLRTVPIPTDEYGLDVEALERKLEQHRPCLLYTVPVFHNPTGSTLSVERRQQLLRLAREFDFVVVADEVYQLLAPAGQVPLPLCTFDPTRAISLGSFSKILGPGLRLGWIQAAPEHLAGLLSNGVLLSAGGANPFVAAIIESTLDLGLQDVCLRELIAVYESRRMFTVSLLQNLLPPAVRFRPPEGGYFLWIELPPGLDASQLRAEARHMNFDFRPGPLFSCAGNFPNFLRLCCAFYDCELLRFGCEQFGRLLRRHV